MNNSKGIFSSFFSKNVDKNFFNSQNTIISKINAKTLRYLTILAFAFCASLSLIYLIPAKWDPNYYKVALFYVLSTLTYGLDVVLCFTLLGKKNKALHLLYWLFEILSLINFIYVSVYQQPNNTSTIFFALEMLLPMIYMTKTWISIVEHVIAYTVFIITAFIFKDKQVLGQDLIYALLFFFITNIVTIYIRALSIKALESSILFKKESQLDKLTNLYNKSALDTYSREAVGNNRDTIALAIIDVDDFKFVNDRFGYNQGDEYLSKLASTLYRSFENLGIIGRIEGDCFMILFENVFDKKLLEKRINACLDDISKVFSDYTVERITCSCGLSYKEKNEVMSYEKLFNNAKQALQYAKDEGKNKFIVYSKNMVLNGKKNVVLISSNGQISSKFNRMFESNYNIYDAIDIKHFNQIEIPHDLIDVILIDPNNIDLDGIYDIKNQFTFLRQDIKVIAYSSNLSARGVYLNKGFDYFVDSSLDEQKQKTMIKGIIE